jgi:hypothetical protein
MSTIYPVKALNPLFSSFYYNNFAEII